MYRVISFYQFFPIAESALEEIRANFEEFAEAHELCGLLIIATEGINGTVAGSRTAVPLFENYLETLEQSVRWECKFSESETLPFRRFKVKIRDEIVTSGEHIVAEPSTGIYLTPREWHEALLNWEDMIVLDTRNAYETELGTFKGAFDPGLVNFQEFPQFVENSSIPKDKKVLMYCTGGIRCEKASIEMTRRGYEEVYQLQGGILRYLEEYADGLFDGECFVFDHRVALDANLQPSRTYRLCPHCGNPGKTRVNCQNCGVESVICEGCRPMPGKETCSKDCAHQLLRKRKAQ
jgi:UPF0176 protein